MDPTALAKQYKPDFDRDGYVLIRGFFSPEETRELNARFDRVIVHDVPKYPATDAFYEIKGEARTLKYLPRLKEHEPYFGTLQVDSRFVKLAEGLLADGAVPHGIEWFNKCSVVGKETPPHQDGFYYMIEPNEGVHFWLALDNVDEDNGCIRYVKGSHRRGLRDHERSQLLGFSQKLVDYGPQDEAMSEPMIMKPGDLLVHHTLTIHRADANPSKRERRAMGLVFFAARAKVDMQRREAYQKKLESELAKSGKI